MMEQTIKEKLIEGKMALKEADVAEYSLDATLFMMEVTGLDKVKLVLNDTQILENKQIEEFDAMVERRKKKEPTQYILGKCEFMGLEFIVNKNVLIPRPDTEILIETVLKFSNEYKFEKLLDIGTGSGCIPISLLKNGIKEAYGADISESALAVAKENALKHNLKINFVKSDVLSYFNENFTDYFNIIVSNPPYIETSTIETLMEGVKNFEPYNALDGGEDGLYFYRKIAHEGRKYLKENGMIFFEIGYNQGITVSEILKSNNFYDIEIIKDLAGLDRVVLGKKQER